MAAVYLLGSITCFMAAGILFGIGYIKVSMRGRNDEPLP